MGSEMCIRDRLKGVRKPILVKVAPDMTDEQLIHIAKTTKNNGADGIVVSNTTVERPETSHPRDASVFGQQGGMSGQPLKDRSTLMIRQVRQAVGKDWPIIGVGGIANAQDAWEKLEAGATLIQAYSGFVFEGPSLTKQVVHGLSKRLKASQHDSITDVVGTKSD